MTRIDTHPLGPDRAQEVRFLRFGSPGARPKAYLQAALHADELPGILVLRKLADALAEYDARDHIPGEVVIVPAANPIGLGQVVGGYMRGRVEEATGRNFNRGYPDLVDRVHGRVAGRLGANAAENTKIIREAIREAIDDLPRPDSFTTLQLALFREASDADIALDVHADNEALLHMYTNPTAWPDLRDLAAELDARAVLLEVESGGQPFDETCGRVWRGLQAAFPDLPIPLGCLSATVELRSNNHVTHADSDRDQAALLRFLMRKGVVAGTAGAMPRLLAEPTDLRAMQQLKSPVEGVVAYRRALGDTVRQGEVIAEIIPVSGDPVDVTAATDGLLFARHDQTWAWPGKVIGKVAGREILPDRTGPLLTD